MARMMYTSPRARVSAISSPSMNRTRTSRPRLDLEPGVLLALAQVAGDGLGPDPARPQLCMTVQTVWPVVSLLTWSLTSDRTLDLGSDRSSGSSSKNGVGKGTHGSTSAGRA